jgi:hypothetical protein
MGSQISKSHIDETQLNDLKKYIPEIVDQILDLPFTTNDISTNFSTSTNAINTLFKEHNKSIISDTNLIKGLSIGLTAIMINSNNTLKSSRIQLIKYLENMLNIVVEVS